MTHLDDLIRAERVAFIGLLESLTDDQWRSPTLCSAWSVEDVAAHLAWAPVAGPLELAPMALRARFRTNDMIAAAAVAWTDRGRRAILEQLRTNVDTNAKPLGMPRVSALADALVHGLDVCRPLGLPSAVDPDAFALVADWILTLRWPLSGAIGGNPRRRLRGTRLVATDADWSWGQGTDQALPVEDLLLILTGRDVARTTLE